MLKSEIAALQSGNTKVVLENGRLLDELANQHSIISGPTSAFEVMADHFGMIRTHRAGHSVEGGEK